MSDSKNPMKFLYVDFDLEFEDVLLRFGIDWRLPNMIACEFAIQVINMNKCPAQEHKLLRRFHSYTLHLIPLFCTDNSYFHMHHYTINKHETTIGLVICLRRRFSALQTYAGNSLVWDLVYATR